MRQLFRTLLITGVAGWGLSACEAAKTPEELIIGDWVQADVMSISDAGVSIEVSDTSIRYLTNGTSQSTSILTIDNVPDALSTYRVAGTGIWRIESQQLIENMTSVKINNPTGNPQAALIAQQMEMTILSGGESSADILALSDIQLNLRETETGSVMRFKRR